MVLFALAAVLDRRAMKHGRRPWNGRRGMRFLERAARAHMAVSATAFLSDLQGVRDGYDLDEGKHKFPEHPNDPAP